MKNHNLHPNFQQNGKIRSVPEQKTTTLYRILKQIQLKFSFGVDFRRTISKQRCSDIFQLSLVIVVVVVVISFSWEVWRHILVTVILRRFLSPRGRSGVVRGSFRVVWWSFRGRSGIVRGSFWGRWGSFGAVPGSFGGSFGTRSEVVRQSFGVRSKIFRVFFGKIPKKISKKN